MDDLSAKRLERGSGLIMEHVAMLERRDMARVSARARLEAALGDDLTRLLVGALTTESAGSVVDDDLDDSAA